MRFAYSAASSNKESSKAGSFDASFFGGRFWTGKSWADAKASAARIAADERQLKRAFWRKLRSLAARLPFAEDLLAAHYCAFDRQTPLRVKAALVGALAYFVLPADVIPDVLPIIGYSDDAAVLAAAIRLVASHITDDHREAARRTLSRLRAA
jgi:uncharacterized membrane protein YkvA (DUF1232 family)